MNPSKIRHNGEEHTIEEWSVIYGLDYDAFLNNLRKTDFDIDSALKVQNQKRERIIKFKGKTQNLTEWSKELNIPYYCLRSRLNRLKWTVEKAFTTPYEGAGNDK